MTDKFEAARCACSLPRRKFIYAGESLRAMVISNRAIHQIVTRNVFSAKQTGQVREASRKETSATENESAYRRDSFSVLLFVN